MSQAKEERNAVMIALDGNAKGYETMLPSTISAEKFIRICKTAISKTPALLECTKPSLYLAVEEAARDGLVIDGKEAALVSFSTKKTINGKDVWVKEAKYMPMVGGLMKLARNTGLVTTPIAEVFYKNDLFEFWTINGALHLKHAPTILGDRGEAIGVYATCQIIKTGECVAEVLTAEQVSRVRAASKVPGSLMWTTFWEEGWKKSAIRRMFKRLPRSSDNDCERFESAVTREDNDYDFNNQPEGGATATELQAEDVTPNKPKQTKAAAAVAAATPNPEPEAKPELDVQETFEEVVEIPQSQEGDIF